jgi:hypothetical protein
MCKQETKRCREPEGLTLFFSFKRHSWHIDDIGEYTQDNKNERLKVCMAGGGNSGLEEYIELSSLDDKGQAATEFLNELVSAIDFNKYLQALFFLLTISNASLIADRTKQEESESRRCNPFSCPL